MTKKAFIMDLAKLVIAAAWADGELAEEERDALKEGVSLILVYH